VVVVVVIQPEDQAAALVSFPGDGLALHGEPEVLHRRPCVGDGEAIVGPIGVGLNEDVLAAGSVVDGLDHPFAGTALPGPPEGEALGRLTRLVRFKIEPGCRALLREGGHRQAKWKDQTQQLESWLHAFLPPEISVQRMSPPFSSTPMTPVPRIRSGSGTFLSLV